MDLTDKNNWRLIRSSPSNGADNMAVDEAILRAVCNGESDCTLRLYAWQPACLSIGYAQPIQDVDRPRVEALGWDIVRRPTGGRAILHADELTYAVIAPAHHPSVSGGVLASYRKLSAALVQALEILGLRVIVAPDTPLQEEQRQDPVCFHTPSAYEITVRGKKVVGSAQVRRSGGVLQHGTIPLGGDISRICEALKYETEAARTEAKNRIHSQAASLEDMLGTTVTWDEAADALTRSFRQSLGWTFTQGGLSEGELTTSRALIQDRYRSELWTERM